MEVRRKGLRSMRRLLPRMQLAGYASAVLHPLIRVVDGPTVRAPLLAFQSIAARQVAYNYPISAATSDTPDRPAVYLV